MKIEFTDGAAALPTRAVKELVHEVSEKVDLSPPEVVEAAGGSAEVLSTQNEFVDSSTFWPIARFAYERNLIDLLPAHGLPSLNYDLLKEVCLEGSPLGLAADFSQLRLAKRPTQIAGFEVDFPLGVPASILTANSSFLRYYADRGYCILTFKTVRSQCREAHSYPQWVFLENADELVPDEEGKLADTQFEGRALLFPAIPEKAAMANSFGVPSPAPSEWQHDLRAAREFVRPGHQVLIASVMSSADDRDARDLKPVIDDFIQTALLAKEAGADIIELNLSCPNTKERPGDLYHFPTDTAEVLRAVRSELGTTPVFIKIGYLPDDELAQLFAEAAPFIDGVVAINTISARVLRSGDNTAAPFFLRPNSNDKAGISGWPVRRAAQRMAGRLSNLRDEYARREGKRLTILGVGGVMDKNDFAERLRSGVDAVGICTGSYLNPFLGFEIRAAEGKIELELPRVTIDPSPSRTGALDRSISGVDERVSERSATLVQIPLNKNRLDPVEAIEIFENYVKTVDKDTRAANFAPIAAKILADMDAADDAE